MPYAVAILKTDRVAGAPPQVTMVRQLLPERFSVAPEVAAQEFVPAGSPDGELPASAWWLATLFSDVALLSAKQIAQQFPGSRVETYDLNNNPLKPWDILSEMGMKPINKFNKLN